MNISQILNQDKKNSSQTLNSDHNSIGPNDTDVGNDDALSSGPQPDSGSIPTVTNLSASSSGLDLTSPPSFRPRAGSSDTVQGGNFVGGFSSFDSSSFTGTSGYRPRRSSIASRYPNNPGRSRPLAPTITSSMNNYRFSSVSSTSSTTRSTSASSSISSPVAIMPSNFQGTLMTGITVGEQSFSGSTSTNPGLPPSIAPSTSSRQRKSRSHRKSSSVSVAPYNRSSSKASITKEPSSKPSSAQTSPEHSPLFTSRPELSSNRLSPDDTMQSPTNIEDSSDILPTDDVNSSFQASTSDAKGKKPKRSKAPNSTWSVEDDTQLLKLMFDTLPKQDYDEYARILKKRDGQTVRYRVKVLLKRAVGEKTEK